MRRGTSTFIAILLAGFGCAVVVVLGYLMAFWISLPIALSSLDKTGCTDCPAMGPAEITMYGVFGAGVAVGLIAFWGIFQVMRPRPKQKSGKR